jgi:hypothetical protein
MMEIAEERTAALHAMLRAQKAKGALDANTGLTSTREFFAQGAARRWEEQKRSLKARADQVYAQLRNAERDWNVGATPGAPSDSFERPGIPPVYDTSEPETEARNALERGAYNYKRRYIWRTSYYNRMQ